MSTMSIDTLIGHVTRICQKNGVAHLLLIGSFATGTARKTSDIDFAVKGCKDILKLEEEIIYTSCQQQRLLGSFLYHLFYIPFI